MDPFELLIIEDNPRDTRLIDELLAQARPRRFRIEAATTLSGGLDRLNHRGFDVILLDLGLPDSQGLETFLRVQKRVEGIPVVVMSGLDDEAVAHRAVEAGAQDYLVKRALTGELVARSLSYAINRKRAEEELVRSATQLAVSRSLASRLFEAQDWERQRIARELHDSTAQNLTAIGILLSVIAQSIGNSDAKTGAILGEALSLAEQCSQEIRTISYLLHPPMLEEVGLVSALKTYSEGFMRRSNISVAFDVSPGFARLPQEVEIALFRVAQEALANVHRHSESAAASINVFRNIEDVVLEVKDVGRGIKPAILERPGQLGVGIIGMKERLRQLGGRLEIESGADGTRVRAVVPLPLGD